MKTIFTQFRRLGRKTFTPRRGTNLLRSLLGYRLSLLLRRPIVLSKLPTQVMIELTNVCNLKCPLCPAGTGELKRARGFMEWELYKRIIDELRFDAGLVCLWNQGESFLHPDFYEMVRYASSRKLYTYASTNASLDIKADELVKCGLDSLLVSLDGATPETYNQYRVNGVFEKVLANISAIVAAKRKLNSPVPLVQLQFIVMRHNEHEMAAISCLGRELEVDQLVYKTAQIYSAEEIEFLPENEKYRRYTVEDGSFRLKGTLRNRCWRLWFQPAVSQDGTVAPCCFDKDVDFAAGNIGTTSFRALWRGQKMNALRRKILTDRAAVPMCRNCGEGIRLNIRDRDV